MAYDYKEAIKQDIREYLNDNGEIDSDTDFRELENQLDKLPPIELWSIFHNDSVTGGYSRSYTFDQKTAKEHINGNIDLLQRLCFEAYYTSDELFDLFMDDEEWEAADTNIRIMLLPECLHEVLEEKREELEEAESLDEDNAFGKD
jgi:hypothetical protein